MIEFFLNFSNLAIYLAMILFAVFTIGLLINSKAEASVNAFSICKKNIIKLQIIGVLFIVLAWFLITGQSVDACLNGYVVLSQQCLSIGQGYFSFFIICTILAMILSFKKEQIGQKDVMKFVISNHVTMGTLFMIASFLLNVQSV